MSTTVSRLHGFPLWSLREGLAVREGPGNALRVVGAWHDAAREGTRAVEVDVRVDDPSPVLRESLRRMTLGPVALQNVRGLGGSFANWRRGDGDCTQWRQVKAALDLLGGSVVPSIGPPQRPGLTASLLAVERGVAFDFRAVGPAEVVATAPGARLRPVGRLLELRPPGAPYRARLHDEASVAAVDVLVRTGRASARELARRIAVDACDRDLVCDLLGYLRTGGLVRVDPR